MEGFAKANGRIEATQIEIASKSDGRVSEVLVKEGDAVTAGQVLARMDVRDMNAELAEARANVASADSAKATAAATVLQQQSSLAAAKTAMVQRQVTLANAQKTLDRTKALVSAGSAPNSSWTTTRRASTRPAARSTRPPPRSTRPRPSWRSPSPR